MENPSFVDVFCVCPIRNGGHPLLCFDERTATSLLCHGRPSPSKNESPWNVGNANTNVIFWFTQMKWNSAKRRRFCLMARRGNMNHLTHHAKYVFLVLLHSLARISLGSRAQQQKSFRFERWPCDHLSRPAICIARTHAIAQRAQISLLQVSCRGDSSESVWKLDFFFNSLTLWVHCDGKIGIRILIGFFLS